jgi:hypothetical protein
MLMRRGLIVSWIISLMVGGCAKAQPPQHFTPPPIVGPVLPHRLFTVPQDVRQRREDALRRAVQRLRDLDAARSSPRW